MTKHSNGILELTVPEDIEVKTVIINGKDYIRNPWSVMSERLSKAADGLTRVFQNWKEWDAE